MTGSNSPLSPPPLQALVDIGFRLSTGSVEALRPSGAQLLREVVVAYADLEDPLLPGTDLDLDPCIYRSGCDERLLREVVVYADLKESSS